MRHSQAFAGSHRGLPGGEVWFPPASFQIPPEFHLIRILIAAFIICTLAAVHQCGKHKTGSDPDQFANTPEGTTGTEDDESKV
jgi:hypothetical protein